jgi:hypothetical protein
MEADSPLCNGTTTAEGSNKSKMSTVNGLITTSGSGKDKKKKKKK